MSRTGDCYDNAVAESFFATLKTEHVDHEQFASRERAHASIADYIERFYKATTTPSASAAPSAIPACRTVSYFDTEGNRHFRQECP